MNERRVAPAAERNKGPILEVLRRVLPDEGTVLEIASGSGQHAVFFAEHLPGLVFQPSDANAETLGSVRAWIAESGVTNVNDPVVLDVRSDPWPVTEAAAVVSINMIHIAPWEATLGLLDGAARILHAGGVLVLYGPFRRGGEHTAPSNAAFDESLRARDPAWGVRDLDEVSAEAATRGLALDDVVEMPANNLTVVFRRGR